MKHLNVIDQSRIFCELDEKSKDPDILGSDEAVGLNKKQVGNDVFRKWCTLHILLRRRFIKVLLYLYEIANKQ